MPVDLATLSLELQTTGLQRGATQAASILSGLEARLDRLAQRAQRMGKIVGDAFSFGGGRGDATSRAFDKIQSDFARHNQKIVETAAKTGSKLQEIEAQKNRAITLLQEKAAAQSIATDKKIVAQAQANAAKLEQIQTAAIGKALTAEQKRFQAQEANQARAQQQAASNAAKIAQLQAVAAGRVGASFNQRAQNKDTIQGRLEQEALRGAAKLEAISTASSARRLEIEQKRLAQLDVVRERFVQREAERQRKLAERTAANNAPGAFLRRFSSTIREAGESIQQTGYFLTGLSTSLIAVGSAAVKSAFDIDKNVNVLRALLGSSEAAEARFKELVAISQKTPGLTTAIATQIDAQLRVANATEAAINKVLPAIGKLNAVSNIQDPQRFVQNLVQLVTQNFERIDLKELVGQSPLAGELIKQIFNVDSPINGEAIRTSAQRLGLTTVDAFFTAFGEAAAKNTKLANIGESLSTQFAKLVDRVTIALRPLGLAIIETLGPIIQKGASIIESLGQTFNSLPPGVKSAAVAFGILAAAIGPAVLGIGAFIQAAGALGNLATVATSLKAVSVALTATTAASTAAGAAAATAGATTVAAFAPVLPILLAVAAVVGVVAIAWLNYESAAEKAAKITTEQVQSTINSRNELAGLSNELNSSTAGHGKLADVLAKMPASSQAFAAALKDEGEKLAFVTTELERQRGIRESTIAAQSTTLAAGLAAQQKEIDLLRTRREELEREADAVFRAGQSGQKQLVTDTTQGRRIETTIQAQTRLESSLQGVTKAETEATKARDASIQKLDLAEKGLGRTRQGLIEYLNKAGLSTEETNRLTRGIEQYESQQRRAAGATNDSATAMNDLGAAARQAGQDVANAFLQFDLSGIQKGIQAKTQELAGRIVKEGISAKKALADAQNQIIGTLPVEGDNFPAVLGFGEANKRAQALQKAQEDLNKLISPSRKSGGSRGESAARQLRAAEEELEKARAAAIEAIQTRSLQAQLEAEKDNFEKRLIGAQAFFEARKKIELELIALTERRIKAEAAASTRRLLAAKEGSPEALREIAQLVALQSQLRILEIDRTDKLKDLNAELEKNLKLERERRQEILRAVAASVGEGLSKAADQIRGLDQAALGRPNTELRREEIRLQSLAAAGLIRETELTDALILVRRKYREEMIRVAEVEKARLERDTTNAGRFSEIQRIEEEILSLQGLGAELTRAEALQRRFAEQGILDYSRLNESLEDFLASQKGITEIFADFRTNLVADQFDLIDQSVDKLTARLGILGDAIGSLLKDLAKLALSKIFQKLFGIGGGGGIGGQQPAFGGGGGGGGGGSILGSLFGGGGSGGGSGFGQFSTGGFAGGNPVQQVLGGGGSGGSSPIGGLLKKIPGIGKLFGAGGGGGGINNLPIFTQGEGGGALSQSGGALGGSSALGSLSGLGAGGLLAGGGILGSFAGGNSQIGRLLGGVGGTLLGGALGASGLLGGGIAGALPALFSNPITAIVGGALIGGALLFRFFADREFNKFRKIVEKTYQLKVDGKQGGRGLYKSEKELGEELFGKGKFGKNIQATIQSKRGEALLAAYGEASGQENNPLVKRYRETKELTDFSDPRNEFIKRAHGGDVNRFRPYIVGDAGRPEVFVPRTSGQIYPSIADFMREIIGPQNARSHPATGGGWTAEARKAVQMLMGVMVANTEAIGRLQSFPPEHVVAVGAPRVSRVIAGVVHSEIERASNEGIAIKNEVYKGR